jgi:hypothetical protein
VNPAWIAAIGSLAGIVLGLVVWIARSSWRLFRRTDQFLEDWNGVPADTGHEIRPGVLQRLAQLEHQMTDVQGQVHLNSGHSLRDEVQRTETTVSVLQGQVGQLQGQVSDLQATVDRNHKSAS